jgi:DNA mismatch repair ATPase MutL
VRVTDIFGTLPVRKQTAEKDASKCLAKMKKLLQSYALARPHVRLSLRVLKAKNEKGNFSYAPRSGGDASIRDAAWKVIGSDAASQCEWFVLQAEDYEIQALLPTPDANAKAISNIGHFISIDWRPVSTTRGSLYHVSKLISGKLRGSNFHLANIRDPFFAINIACPEGSYDPNVEPAKDDVLFHDADRVIKIVKELLSTAYLKLAQEPEVAENTYDPRTENKIPGSEGTARPEDIFSNELLERFIDDINEDDIEIIDPNVANTEQQETSRSLRSPRTDRETGGQPEEDEGVLVEPLANTDELEVLESRANIWRPTMYGFDDEEVDMFAAQEHDEADKSAEPQQVDQRDINPWTIARMRAGRKSQQIHASVQETPGPRTRARSLSHEPHRQHRDVHHDGILTAIFNDDMQAAQPSGHSRARLGLLQLGMQPISANQVLNQARYAGGLPTPQPSSSPPHEPLYQRPTQPSWNHRQRKADKALNQAFKPPARQRHANDQEDEFEPTRPPKRTQRRADGDRDIAQMLRGIAQNQPLGPIGEPEEAVIPSDADLENEFRTRLRQAGEVLDTQYSQRVMARQDECDGGQVPAVSRGGWTPINPVPQHAHELQPVRTTTPSPPSSKRRRTTEYKRTKSSRRPLEHVPDGAELHDLVQRVSLSSAKLESLMFHFADALTCDVDYDTAASDAHDADLVKELEDKPLSKMIVRAVTLLRQKLHVAEGTSNEDLRLAHAGTLARPERMAVED